MEIAAGERRRLKFILLSLFLTVAAAFVFYNCCFDVTLAAMYRGESLRFLNHLIHNTGDTPLSYYVSRGRNLFSYLILIDVVAHMILAALLAHDFMRRILVDFFTTPTSPLNLAIFRVAVFVGVLSQVHPSETIWFGKVPHELQMAPFGVAWLLPYLPVSKSLMTIAVVLLIAACVTGILGLFTRTSAVLALIGSFYVLGVPEFYGTVEHYHHLLWFLAILAVSRSGDALSVDAILKIWKRAEKGSATLPPASIVYSLPLRFACLLLGVIYFFPGLWKIRICGFDWAFSENLRYQMYARWMELDGLTPFFRLDLHPWLYKSVALGTLVFELSFIFVIFFPRLRIVLALVGLGFHFGSGLYMRIPFFDLWICYVALFDVSGWLERLGRRRFPGGCAVFYDGGCSFCRRTISIFRVLDILNCLAFVDALDDTEMERRGFSPSDRQAFLRDMHAVSGKRIWVGFRAYRSMAIRVPLLWLIVPILYLPLVEDVGNKLYRRAADMRTCNLNERDASRKVEALEISARQCAPIVIIGILLLVASSYCGEQGIVRGWPFACYPRFAWNPGNEIESVEISALTPGGKVVFQDTPDLHRTLKYHAFGGQLASLLSKGKQDPSGFAERIKALWKLHVQQDPRLEKASIIRCYRVTLNTIPERRNENPIERELIFDFRP
jgi:predicted DCC family thiol-disulfide oxidoreductase YuxK